MNISKANISNMQKKKKNDDNMQRKNCLKFSKYIKKSLKSIRMQ